jgi:hypothetical protein
MSFQKAAQATFRDDALRIINLSKSRSDRRPFESTSMLGPYIPAGIFGRKNEIPRTPSTAKLENVSPAEPFHRWLLR